MLNELTIETQKVLSKYLQQKQPFSAYSITSTLRLENPRLRVPHSEVKPIVYGFAAALVAQGIYVEKKKTLDNGKFYYWYTPLSPLTQEQERLMEQFRAGMPIPADAIPDFELRIGEGTKYQEAYGYYMSAAPIYHVESTFAKAWQYANGILVIFTQRGEALVYNRVSSIDIAALISADSFGRAFNKLKGNWTYLGIVE